MWKFLKREFYFMWADIVWFHCRRLRMQYGDTDYGHSSRQVEQAARARIIYLPPVVHNRTIWGE